MATDVTMPRLSDSMEEGTILKWLVSEGDEVTKGQEIVEIETDKANMTYEADSAGVIAFVAAEGDTLALGEVIARIGAGGEDAADSGDDEKRETKNEVEPEAESGSEEPEPEKSSSN